MTLQEEYPELAKEWSKSGNNGKTLNDFSKGSHYRATWRGKCGHFWKAPIKARITYDTGCPFCSNSKVLPGFNDLETKYPDIAKEWHPAKNGDLLPNNILPGSQKKVYWLCLKGHTYESSVYSRVSGKGCRYCAGNAVWKGFNDLETTHPDIAKLWHPTKNGDLKPFHVSRGCNKEVWWLDKCHHEYPQKIHAKITNKLGCPYCSGKKVLAGFNDLKTLIPYLAAEWDYEENKTLTPDQVTKGSHIMANWICTAGHKYRMKIEDRTLQGQGCPECAKERKTSFPEQAIFYYVSQIYTDSKNRDCSYGFELDIYIPQRKIGIEYDGWWHKNIEKDKKKNEKCIQNEITLIRVLENNKVQYSDCICVYRNSNKSRKSIEDTIREILQILVPNNNIDVDLQRDYGKIYNAFVTSSKENNLKIRFPELSLEWNYEKNEGVGPESFSAYSNKVVWWKGKCGHEWPASVESRVYGQGCSVCAGKRVVKGINDFESQSSILLKEWDWERNEKKPSEYTAHSKQDVYWICSKGHSYVMSPRERSIGEGCPVCAGKVVLQGYNDLMSQYPQIAKQWDYENNGELEPNQVMAHSSRRVNWICPKGHRWAAIINSRTKNKKDSCPVCSNRLIQIGINDVVTIAPFVLSEFDDNNEQKEILYSLGMGSAKVFQWKCPVCNGSYPREIRSQILHTARCRICKCQLNEYR